MVACNHVHSQPSKKEDKQTLWVCSYFWSDNCGLSLNPEHGWRGVLEQYLCKIRQIFGQNCKWIFCECNTRFNYSFNYKVYYVNEI